MESKTGICIVFGANPHPKKEANPWTYSEKKESSTSACSQH